MAAVAQAPHQQQGQQVQQQQQQQQHQAAGTNAQIDAQHTDMIHCAELDYYGRRIATCSSDKQIHVTAVAAGDSQPQVLAGHEAPVWQVKWSHPRQGPCLVSCGYDGRVIVWRESLPSQQWEQLYAYQHSASVNAVAINHANEQALEFASGASDGRIVVHQWVATEFKVVAEFDQAHRGGVFALDYSPTAGDHRLVSGGADSMVKLWQLTPQQDGMLQLTLIDQLQGHQDWVRDVAWAPFPHCELIASCSSDKTVLIWSSQLSAGAEPKKQQQQWQRTVLSKKPFADCVWRVSFSQAGGYLLAVSCADGKVTLWRMTIAENEQQPSWECIGEVEDK